MEVFTFRVNHAIVKKKKELVTCVKVCIITDRVSFTQIEKIKESLTHLPQIEYTFEVMPLLQIIK